MDNSRKTVARLHVEQAKVKNDIYLAQHIAKSLHDALRHRGLTPHDVHFNALQSPAVAEVEAVALEVIREHSLVRMAAS